MSQIIIPEKAGYSIGEWIPENPNQNPVPDEDTTYEVTWVKNESVFNITLPQEAQINDIPLSVYPRTDDVAFWSSLYESVEFIWIIDNIKMETTESNFNLPRSYFEIGYHSVTVYVIDENNVYTNTHVFYID